MKKLIGFSTIAVVTLMVVFFQNCSKPRSVLTGSAVNKEMQLSSMSEKLVTLAFYRGGWYGPADQPNFSDDMRLSFLESGQVNVFSLTTDGACQKYGVLTSEQKAQLKSLLDSLQIASVTEANIIPLADGGDEKLTLTYETGHQKIIHLNSAPAEANEYYLKSANDISLFLQNINDELATTTCK